MNTVNNLFDKIVSKENILAAIHKAAKGKRHKRIVRRVLENPEEVADRLSQALKQGTWRPNAVHNVKIINDGIQQKKREIVCPDFVNEQIVHHAILGICIPIFQRRFYRYSCASIPGRGVEYALKYIRKAQKDYKNTKYFAVVDIRKFFNSIRPSKVFHALRRIIRDRRLLGLFARILRANKVIYADGSTRKHGAPIGLYTSPWFANILLTALDNQIKADGVKYYIRYNDDMLLFHSNKRKLKRVLERAEQYINNLGLELKRPYQIHRLAKVKIDYIGATISQNNITLRGSVFLRAKRTAKRISKKPRPTIYDAYRIVSYAGRFRHFDAYNAFRKHISSKASIRQMRKKISKGAVIRNVYQIPKQGKAIDRGECRQQPLHRPPEHRGADGCGW
jgi:RNA-directed DNA polymerase